MKKAWCGVFIACLLTASTVDGADDWAQRFPLSHPSARVYSEMAFIGGDKVLLFGGHTTVDNNETWLYDLSDNTWTQKFPASSPSARREHGMAYIGGDKVLLFGGNNGSTETWVYDLSENTWTNKNPPGDRPGGRNAMGLAYIGGDQALLFGGSPGVGVFNDTWVYDLSDNSWTLIDIFTRPSARRAHGMAYIGEDRVLIFGGDDGFYNLKNDTWVYDLSDSSWTAMSPASKPSHRWGHALAYMGGDQVLFFGGANSIGLNEDDTWVYDLSENNWTLDTNTVQPSGRKEMALSETSMDGSGPIVLFGGIVISNSDETWIFGGGDYPMGRPQVTVIYPNGGELFRDSLTISWMATDPVPGDSAILMVDLDYSANSGSTWSAIDSNQINSGSYFWNISELEDGMNYLVRGTVTDTLGLFDTDTCDAFFAIDNPDPPQVHVIHPNGDEVLVDSVTVTWTATDPDSADVALLLMDLEYSGNAGTTWAAFDSNQVNDGAYFWDISGLPDGTEYLVRVSAIDTTSLSGSDTSDAIFEINDPPPHIASVQDVPEDQGRQVSVLWDRSGLDQPAYQMITDYSIWRKTPPGSKIVMIGDEWDGSLPVDLRGIIYRIIEAVDAKGEGQKGYWELVGTQEAHYFEGYSYTAPTQYDSSAGNPALFSFIVSAHTSDPYVFYDSTPDSGYSVDDIDPAKTQIGIMASGSAKGPVNTIWLAWTQVTTGDDGSPEQGPVDYRVYCDESFDFAPGPGNLVATTPDLSYAHTDSRIGDPAANLYYLVTAVDQSGNESAVSNVVGEFDKSLEKVK